MRLWKNLGKKEGLYLRAREGACEGSQGVRAVFDCGRRQRRKLARVNPKGPRVEPKLTRRQPKRTRVFPAFPRVFEGIFHPILMMKLTAIDGWQIFCEVCVTLPLRLAIVPAGVKLLTTVVPGVTVSAGVFAPPDTPSEPLF